MKKLFCLIPSLLMISSLVGCAGTTQKGFSHDYEVMESVYSYKDYANNSYYNSDYCPTIGEPKILVIPVWFTNTDSYILEDNKELVRDDIRKAYVGTPEETGWHSVSSYYQAESFGKCKIQATISDWYECGHAASYYYDEEIGVGRVIEMLIDAVEWYFENNPEDDRTSYDLDKNGQLDGVMLIYGSPDYTVLPSAGFNNNDESRENMWAYCNWVSDVEHADVNKPIVNVYFWASYDFMYSSGNAAKARTGKSSAASGDTSHCIIDTHTYIHEMGHVFGLEDYYDYSRASYCPAGGFSMQDYNVGGHDPFSLMAFNWIDPIVVHNDCTIDLNTFQETHQVILLSDTRTYSRSPFDEYMLLELYSPTRLNKFDSDYQYDRSYPQGPSQLGIRLWHVDARLVYFEGKDVIVSEMYNNPKVEGMKVGHAFSNTYEDPDYGSILGRYNGEFYYYNILQLIRNNRTANVKNKKTVKDTDLFHAGDSYKQFDFTPQFVNGNRLNNLESLNWSFTVNSIGTYSANITFHILGSGN